jgi:3-hydroxyisobutyrate dehydrogenase-like beta-hydroxyacid dehydrogenase
MDTIRAPARIGWIGLGKMGLPICQRLHNVGFRVRALCRNATTERIATANGFEVARTILETAEGADVVASAVSDDKALVEIVLGRQGLKDRLSREQIYIDISTVSPDASARVAEAMSPVGNPYLRAPVSGSTATAAQGALTALVSGPAEAFGAMADFFSAFTRKAFLVGPGEEARYLKLSINAMLAATSALLAESLMLARKGGMDIQTIMDVVSESAVASPLIQYKRGAITTGDYAAAFSTSQMLKDLDLVEQAAAATSCDMPLISSVRDVYRAAVARGLGDQDFFVLTSPDAARGPDAKQQ